MFSYQDLRLVLSVAQHQSFSAAAQELHKVPSAISYSVKTLEQALGAQLFERRHRQVTLTEAGHYFVGEAQRLLKQMDEVRYQTQRIANGWHQSVKLALDNVVRPAPVNQLVRDFHQAFPEVELRISMEVYNGVWDALADERADIAIGATAAVPVEGPFASRPMGELKWLFVVAAAHPLAELDGPLSDSQVAGYPSICLEDTSRSLNKRTTWLVDHQRRLVVPNWSAAIECFVAGLGVGVMPEHLALPLVESGKLVVRELERPLADSPCCLAWNVGNESGALAWLLEYLGDSEELGRVWL
ncbi:DNA-binding transcriptional activator PunR [Paraferrimonas sedimenticola]|uniref:LysR family transcriptional regulator n=1 Tax=Paraferrimonas sedimenticola TaxID=375674 RepID=A0AA37VT88_9GAMM|nr:DNA-binding transcriptional activator PunR [Paraferrimonas sedimenticola]GLP95171.1 LysR family transcriptional regulator [Paraferrimonas sedimenticola]